MGTAQWLSSCPKICKGAAGQHGLPLDPVWPQPCQKSGTEGSPLLSALPPLLCSCSYLSVFLAGSDEAALGKLLGGARLTPITRATVLRLEGGKELAFVLVPTPRWPDLVGFFLAALCFFSSRMLQNGFCAVLL